MKIKQHGFTLVEVIIVIVIISVFAAFAIPNYQEQMRKKDRAVVQQELQRLATELDRFKSKNFSYKGFNIQEVLSVSGSTATTLDVPILDATKKFRITLKDGDDRSLTSSTSSGLAWVMTAERLDENEARQYKYITLTSTGKRCMTKKSSISAKTCTDAGEESW